MYRIKNGCKRKGHRGCSRLCKDEGDGGGRKAGTDECLSQGLEGSGATSHDHDIGLHAPYAHTRYRIQNPEKKITQKKKLVVDIKSAPQRIPPPGYYCCIASIMPGRRRPSRGGKIKNQRLSVAGLGSYEPRPRHGALEVYSRLKTEEVCRCYVRTCQV